MGLCKKTLTIGMATLLFAAPVYAATPMGVTNPDNSLMMDLTKHGKKAKKQKQEAPKVVTPKQEEVKVNQVAPSVIGGAAPVLVENAGAVEQAGPRDERLAPYIGKRITKQLVSGNSVVPTDVILAAVQTKPGMEFTEDGLGEDLAAIYATGWFYDLAPEFTAVPEGVQVTYHVMENPVYEKVNISGSTVVDKTKAEGFFGGLEKGQIANLQEINKCVQKLQEEYRSNGYILARINDVHMG